MCAADWDARVERDGLTLERYRFGAASRVVPASDIGEVCVAWWPPTVRTRSGEYVFVPAARARPLADLATAHDIPFVQRIDVWSLVLEEFLDTEFTPEQQERTLVALEDNGVTRAETMRWRKLVGKRMLWLTVCTWEWVYYGIYDVLTAMRPFTFTTGWTFERFRSEAQQLADRGRVTSATRAAFLAGFPGEGGKEARA